jgi:alpha-D-xyloside xylohydrolase
MYVKAGSILPIGPKVHYATEKKWDNLEILVYEGANGEFTLYEDENDNYNYEKGAYTTITFSWNDA